MEEIEWKLNIIHQLNKDKIMIKCIKCNTELSPQDSKGWEKLAVYDVPTGRPESEAYIWLCQGCIINFQAVDDLRKGNQDLRDGLLDKPTISYWKGEVDKYKNMTFIEKLKFLIK